jgi:hypothetical protein
MTDVQTIGAGAITVLAVVGFNVPEIPLFYLLMISAVVGSIQAMSVRFHNGSIKGTWALLWGFIAGVTAGYWVGDGIATIMGLQGTTAEILPVYLTSLAGAKLVNAVINLDVGKWLNSILEKRYGNKNK